MSMLLMRDEIDDLRRKLKRAQQQAEEYRQALAGALADVEFWKNHYADTRLYHDYYLWLKHRGVFVNTDGGLVHATSQELDELCDQYAAVEVTPSPPSVRSF